MSFRVTLCTLLGNFCSFWVAVGQFRFPFGSFWVVSCQFMSYFGSFWVILACFGSFYVVLGQFSNPFRSFSYALSHSPHKRQRNMGNKSFYTWVEYDRIRGCTYGREYGDENTGVYIYAFCVSVNKIPYTSLFNISGKIMCRIENTGHETFNIF